MIIHSSFALLALLASSGMPQGESTPQAATPAAVLEHLLAGNARFVADAARAELRRELTTGQRPAAIVLACADSRVAPEIVFDQDLGRIFVVRTAGIVADPVALGSLEYGAEHLGAKVLVVLGHQSCGAVKAGLAALTGEIFPGNIQAVVDGVVPALTDLPTARRTGEAAVTAGILHRVRSLLQDSGVINHLVTNGRLELVGARYDLDTGRVEVVMPASATRALADSFVEPEEHGSATGGPPAEHRAAEPTSLPAHPRQAPGGHAAPSTTAADPAVASGSSLHIEGLVALGVVLAAGYHLSRMRVGTGATVLRPTVGARVVAIMALCAASSYLVGDLALGHIHASDDEIVHIEHEDLPNVEAAFHAVHLVGDHVEAFHTVALTGAADAKQAIVASRSKLQSLQDDLDSAAAREEHVRELPARITALLAIGERLEEAFNTNSRRDVAQLLAEIRHAKHVLDATAEQALTSAHETVSGRVERLTVEAGVAAREVELLFGITLVIGILLSLWLSLWIRKSLQDVCSQAMALKEGDLSRDLVVGRAWSEFAVMRGAFVEMVVRWRSIVASVRDATSHLSSAAEQLSSSSQSVARTSTDVSGLVQQQAAALEEVQASLQQIQDAAFQVASDADNAGRTAQETNSQADRAIQSMESVREAMTDIDKSGKSVQRVIETVQGLAHQTNLLALNAAVEAARAGDVGRGFAVVAEEVRNLAARTQESSKEITMLVETASQRSATGSERTRDAADSFTQVAKGIGTTATLSSSLAAAVEEQTSILKEIGTTIRCVSEGTQRSAGNSQELAATAEELAATSEECSAQSRALVDLVAYFRLDGNPKP
jgi:methyl-accepting chemotaxis protein/carbonic anhydrase